MTEPLIATLDLSAQGERRIWAEHVPDYIQVLKEFIEHVDKDHVKFIENPDDGLTMFMTFKNGEAVYKLYDYDPSNTSYVGKLISWKGTY